MDLVLGDVGLTIKCLSFRIELMKNRRGFTLIELVIVVALIMILASIGLGGYLISTVRSNDTKRRNDLSQIAKAVEIFNADVGRYPIADDSGNMLCMDKTVDESTGAVTITNPACGTKLTYRYNNITKSYLTIPVDNESGNKYIYESTDGKTFAVYTALQNDKDKDLLKDVNGVVISNPYSKVCGTDYCNYKVTESGLSKTNE